MSQPPSQDTEVSNRLDQPQDESLTSLPGTNDLVSESNSGPTLVNTETHETVDIAEMHRKE